MTLLELIDEVYERTHVDRVEIFSRARAAWPGAVEFKPVQMRLLERALSGATPASGPVVAIRQG